MNFNYLQIYFVDGVRVWWGDQEADSWEGFGDTITGQHLPVLIVRVGLQSEDFPAVQRVLTF